MKLYGAIDLHSTNSVTVLRDEQDKVVYRKRFTQRLEVDRRAARSVSIEDGRDRGGVHLQLVLAGGWFDGAGRIVALKAVAHKLCRACYYILRDQVAFDVTKASVPSKFTRLGWGSESLLGLA